MWGMPVDGCFWTVGLAVFWKSATHVESQIVSADGVLVVRIYVHWNSLLLCGPGEVYCFTVGFVCRICRICCE